MNRVSQTTMIAIMMVTGAAAWAQAPGSQLRPEAQPPFSPGSDKPIGAASGRPVQADDKITAGHSSVAAESVGMGSTSPAPSTAQCDLSQCASTYRSFRSSDCTYQPYTGGPRRTCAR
jgi:hypothetical protein